MNTSVLINSRLIEEIKDFIKTEVKNSSICGLSIAIVDDKSTLWSEGFGYTNLEKNMIVTADTLFSIQSMNKTFTATVFLILASKDLINLDDPIRKYYPNFKINTKFGDVDKEISKITFRRMLSHWAGFTHEAPVGNNFDDSPCTFDEHIESISRSWLRNPVGSENAYSNLGIDLTGYVMGIIQNKSFEEVMKEELFSPLGIINATYNIEEALQSSFALGHSGKYATPVIQVPMLPSGGLYISANDVANFISFHLRKGMINNQQLIKPALFEEMYNSQFIETKEFGYGLGIYQMEKIKGSEVIGHDGGGYGYQSIMQWIPEHDLGVVVLTNDMKHNSSAKISKKILELLIENKTQPKSKQVNMDLLHRLEGTYRSYRKPLLNVVIENDKVIIYQSNGSEDEIFPQTETSFITKDNTNCIFTLDEVGNPLTLSIKHPKFAFIAKYNDGPNDKQGPNNKEWNNVVGYYKYQLYGRSYYLALAVINCSLYLILETCLKLHFYDKNKYFTADGEILILKEDKLIYRNIPAHKVKINTEQIIEEIKKTHGNYDYYSGTIGTVINILYFLDGFEKSLNFIDQAVGIDIEYKNNYSILGRKLYSLGKLDESFQCFSKLLETDSKDESAEEFLRKIRLRKKFS